VAEVLVVEPVIRFCAVISADAGVRRQAIERLRAAWGDVTVHSPPLPFEAGGYYAAAMGTDLRKELVAFGEPVAPDELAAWKRWTNAVEVDFDQPDFAQPDFAQPDAAAVQPSGPSRPPSRSQASEVSRPLNLDPGYITQAKLVLATTKDRDHRVYLRDGIFGEITLTYTAKRWIHHRWTYPDYRTASVAEFATQCRRRLRDHLQSTGVLRQRRAQ
jgi:hypothetical protein